MKKIFIYSLLVLFISTLNSCSKEEAFYNFDGTGNAATFASKSLQIPAITKEDNGKVSIPMYRGNIANAASINVEIAGGEGIFTPVKSTYDFAPGENIAYIDFVFDFNKLSARPQDITIKIKNKEDLSINAIESTSITLVRKLTYEKVGVGEYYTDFFEESWEQEIFKAKEGNFYILPSCWVKGVDFSFFYDGKSADLYTTQPGYNYGSYGPVTFKIISQTVKQKGGKRIIEFEVEYYLPEFNNYSFGTGLEILYLPAGL